ncbi:MAG: thrombospondin type 3 repeat-containing protein [Bacteroidales bacterium]|nr:thrombospondin type 3 repeat-containing protein [Bacteroidales bacterium]
MKNFVTKQLIFLIFLSGLFGSSLAQEFLPALNDNYMGINQATLQPGAIADSRFKIDVNFFGFNSDIYNNMIRFKSAGLVNPYKIFTEDDWWDENSYLADPDGKDKSAIFNQTLLGLSFLVTIDQKQAVGFTFRTRNIINVDDVSEPLARSIYGDFKYSEYWQKWYYDENLRAVNHIFTDYGLTYAREVFDLGVNYLKAGLTVKLLQGIGGAYVQADDFYYYFYNQNNNPEDADYMSWNSPYVNSGVSDNWNWGSNENSKYESDFMYAFTAKPSVGLDLGVVYEFRPKYKNYRYDMDGETNLIRKDQNKYMLKVGVSVLDIGRLRYEKAYSSQDFTAGFTPDYLQRYQSSNNAVPGSTHWMDIEEVNFGFPPYVNFADTVYRRIQLDQGITKGNENKEDFTIKLPTAFSLQVDLNIFQGLYLNLTTFTALNQGFSKAGNSHYISNYSLTPRYEHKWFGAMLPMYFNQYQKFNMGIGLRAAFVYFGINNLFTGLFDDPYGSSIYLGVKIPIWYSKPPKDLDNDGVSDKLDNCPTVPGPWEFRGCPDRDGDGVPDHEDECPDIPGLKEFKGCPDRDGDGIPDKDDLCPDEPGPKTTQGCPDRDGDGVPDYLDECPDDPGPASLNGCPDRDGDGVPDHKDLCPDVAGKIEYGGCPFLDTDGDGVRDEDDMCPTIPGPAENRGCPWPDTDGDGIPDHLDKCPLTPGPPENNGCPIIEEKEQEIIKTAFENLEFETGKAVIRSSSFASLNELATLLISKPTWKIQISGHTDSVGSDEANMKLSKDRSQSTAKYLEGRGVAPSRLITEWFGETRPIADNDTPEGRQKNRRVEMQIVFE